MSGIGIRRIRLFHFFYQRDLLPNHRIADTAVHGQGDLIQSDDAGGSQLGGQIDILVAVARKIVGDAIYHVGELGALLYAVLIGIVQESVSRTAVEGKFQVQERVGREVHRLIERDGDGRPLERITLGAEQTQRTILVECDVRQTLIRSDSVLLLLGGQQGKPAFRILYCRC